MPEQLKQMSGDEFVTKLLAGERDFRKIHLEYGYELRIPAVSPTQKYIYNVTRDNDQVREYRIDVSGSNLSGLKSTGLYLPYLTAVGTDFKFADLGGAQFYGGDLQKADFFGANLARTSFSQARLTQANFSKTNLSLTCFYDTDLIQANFDEADFRGADLRGKYLDSTKGLDTAHFFGTLINMEDKKIFTKIIKKREFFRT